VNIVRTRDLAIVGLVLALGNGLSLFAQPTPPAGQHWEVVLALTDDFQTFNASKWQLKHPTWNGRPPSTFSPDNVRFTNGLMQLEMTLADTNQSANWMHAPCVTSLTKSFTVGMYSETCVKVADLSATTSFWMQGEYSEIDVIENFGTVKNDAFRHVETSMMSNTHYFTNGWAKDIATSKEFTNLNQERNTARFFTYGVWWKNNRTVVFYRDGLEVGQVTTGGDFNESMYLFFDMEPMSWGPGIPSASDVSDIRKNASYYRWVHTWVLR
jgi:hypothetical protein